MPIRYEFGEETIANLVMFYNQGRINLSPPFQRESVWTTTDRCKLIDAVVP